MGRRPVPLMDRFLDKFLIYPNDECWPWLGNIGKNGYGQISSQDGKTLSAHRVAWELFCGQIPEGMLVCHTCDNRSCVRLSHLFLGTPQDNMNDKVSKGRWKGRSKK